MHLMEKKVLELIGEDPDSPDVFTDDELGIAPIRDSLNDAIQEIVTITGSNKRQYFIPLRSSQQFYRIKLNYGYMGWITDAWLINKKIRLEQTGLLKMTRHDNRWMVASSTPRSYLPIGNDIVGLYPKPSASADTLELTIVEVPLEYSDENDRIRLKKDFQYAAVEFAVSEYWASRGDAREALTHYELYLNAIGMRDDFDQAPYKLRGFRTYKETHPAETA